MKKVAETMELPLLRFGLDSVQKDIWSSPQPKLETFLDS